MKPTPTTVAMLMSAAGLSLSLPAFAAAHGDANGRPNFVLAFGVPARQSIDVEWSHPVFEAYSASHAAGGAAQQSSHGADREHEADAIAMVLMVHPPIRSQGTSVGASAAPGKPAGGPRQGLASELQPVLEPLLGSTPDETEIGHPIDGGSPDARATRGGLADLATVAPAPPVDLAFEIAETDPSGPTSIERVLNSLAEIAGSQTAPPAPSLGTAEVRTSMRKRDAVASVPATLPEVAIVVDPSASPKEAADGQSSAIERLDAANDIVVAQHGDRVLLNLAALRSDEEPTSGRFEAQTKKTVVASQSEKVLETLALFQQDQARRHVRRAVTGSPAMVPQRKQKSVTTESNLSRTTQIAPVVADKTFEAANSVHERHVLPGAQDAASLQAKHDSSDHVSAAKGAATTAQSEAVAAESPQPIDAERSHPVFDADSASLGARPNVPRAADPSQPEVGSVLAARDHLAAATFGRPDELPPASEAVGAAHQTSLGPDRDHGADAIAMVLMAQPPIRSQDTVVRASPAPGKPAGVPRQVLVPELQPVLELLVQLTPAESEIGHPSDGGLLPHASATQGGLADLAAAAPAPPVPLTFEIAGSQTDAPAPSLGAVEVRTAMQKRDAVASVPATLPEAANVADTSASQIDAMAMAGYSSAIERLDAANGIVVATHGDRVLMSLAELRSDAEPTSGRFGAQTKKTVVASHSEKVLETLALFQQDKARKHVRRAMTGSPARVSQGHHESAATESDLSQTTQIAPVVADKSGEAVNSIHERHVLPRAQDAATLQAKRDATGIDDPVTQEPVRGNPIGSDVVALSTEKLDEVRGGFVSEDGLKVSFGIERAVYLNGSLVTTTSLNVADLSKISGGQAQVTTAGTGSLALVQSGQGNVFLPGSISQTAAGIVIQNTLDNQKIQTITRIDAVVHSSGIIRSMNLQSSMRSAIIDSLRR